MEFNFWHWYVRPSFVMYPITINVKVTWNSGDENRGFDKETKIWALENHTTFITAFLQWEWAQSTHIVVCSWLCAELVYVLLYLNGVELICI